MEARFSAPVQTGPGAHPTSCTMGTVSFPGVKTGWDVKLTPHPLLVPWSRKGRAIFLFPLWAVRPVQSLSACTRVTFTFTFLSVCPKSQEDICLSLGCLYNTLTMQAFHTLSVDMLRRHNLLTPWSRVLLEKLTSKLCR